MTRTNRILALGLTLAASVGAAAGADDRSESVLRRNVEAVGGESAIRAVDTMVMRGKAFAGQMEFAVTQYTRRPGMKRVEFVHDGKTIVQATDGTTAWWHDPVMGSGRVEEMPAVYGATFKRGARAGDTYLWPPAEGVQVEFVGTTQDKERTLQELKVTYPDGRSQRRFFDAASGLHVRTVSKLEMGEVVADFEDFREVGGLRVPFVVSMSMGQRFVYESVRINETIDDAIFAMPTE